MITRTKRILTMALALLTALSLILGSVPGQASAASLKQGSSGSAVTYLQKNLMALGFLEGSADGRYGPMTTEAVRRFQAAYGLGVDGNAGDDTQTALRNAIVRLQVELSNAGFNPGSADGHYGSKTKNALKAYQQAYGLEITGVANEQTRNAMDVNAGGLRTITTLRTGSTGKQVRYLQMALSGLGILSGGVDGSYGPKTAEAVKTYQRAYGLAVDGNAGPDTLTSIRNTIVALQSDLYRRGYASGTINGVYGTGTTAAVKAFQKASGIAVTGVAGPKTMAALYGMSHISSSNVEEGRVYKTWIDPLYQTGDYSKIYYWNEGQKSTTVHVSGCGGVSMAMAANALKGTSKHTGLSVMEWYVDHGYYYGKGTEQRGINHFARNIGLGSTYCDSRSELVSHLKQDRLVIALVKDKTGQELFVNSGSTGHYVLVSGYRVKDGVQQVFINNPLSYKSSRWFDLDDLMANAINENEYYDNSFVVIYK